MDSAPIALDRGGVQRNALVGHLAHADAAADGQVQRFDIDALIG